MQKPGLDSLRGLYVFAHVAQTLSFSRAAELLNITKSAVSKHVAQLEQQLGVQLIVRTTRRLVLTEAGERVQASTERMASDVEAAQDAALAHSSRIAGTLRVTAPAALGRNYLMPVVQAFIERHPDVRFELLIGDDYVDLMAERIDVALRVGKLSESSFISRRIARVEIFVVAAPRYLERHSAPRTPHDLDGHEWVMHGLAGDQHNRTTLRRGKRSVTLQMRGRVACNDGPTNLAGCVAGLGALVVPDFEVAGDIHSGALVRLLPGWRADDVALHLVFPPRRHVLARVRAFADFVAERFRDPPWSCANAHAARSKS
jgi:DNA-binding transcriptional LysR family regulator